MASNLANKAIFVLPSVSALTSRIQEALRAEGANVISDINIAVGRGERTIDGAVFVSPLNEQTGDADLVANYSEPIGVFQELVSSRVFAQAASIVLVIGTSALRASGNPSIAAAEGALNIFFRAFALTFASERIRVNTVMHEWAPEGEPQSIGDRPQADEVAGSIAFFLSDASRWMTRSRLLLDQGASLKTNLGF